MRPSCRRMVIAPTGFTFPPSARANSPAICSRIFSISRGLVTAYIDWLTRHHFDNITHNLASSCRSTSDKLPPQTDAPRFGISHLFPDHVVDCQLDRPRIKVSLSYIYLSRSSLFWRNTNQLRNDTLVETSNSSLVGVHLPHAVRWTAV